MKHSTTILCTALLAAAVATGGCSDGPKRTMDPDVTVGAVGADFSSLQAAVTSSAPGTRIVVSAGMFQEQVIIDKRLIITGSGSQTVLAVPGTKQAFRDDSSDDSSAVLQIRNATGVVIEDMTFSGPEDGISIRDSSNVVLRRVDASGNGDDGVDVRGSSNISVSGTFSANGDKGVLVRDGSAGVVIESSSVSSNADRGIRIRDSLGGTVHDSTVTDNGEDGIQVRDSSGAEIARCTVMGNAGYGIRITAAPDTVLDSNTVTGNAEGDVRQD